MSASKEKEVLQDFYIELHSEQHRREAGGHGSSEKGPKGEAES